MLDAAFQERLEPAVNRFKELYGAGALRILRAPARLNILGEHVDYVSYLPTASLPFGSHEQAMLMLWRPRGDGQVRGASMNAVYEPFAFDLAAGPITSPSWEAWLTDQPMPAVHWRNYVKGACFFAQWQRGRALAHGFDFLIDSTIPPRAGSSSSSALTVLAGAAVRLVNELEFTPAQLADASAQAEWYCGTRGGALDHTAICLAKRGHAVHLSYAGTMTAKNTADMVPLKADRYRWVTFFTHEADKGSHVMLEYNERAAVARLLLPALLADLQAHRPGFNEAWLQAVQELRAGEYENLAECLHELPPAITLAEFARHYPQNFAECERLFPALVNERRHELLKLADRARHHLGEIERVQTAVELLRQPHTAEQLEIAMHKLGRLLNAAHASLRDLYEVSTPEVEQLREVLLADPQVYGARLMGGGFGGNVLALTSAECVPQLIERVQAEFYAPRGRNGWQEGAVLVSTPGAGLTEVLDEQS
jgi:galactokinase